MQLHLTDFLAGQNASVCSRNSLNFMRNRNQCETAHLDICTFNAIVGGKSGWKIEAKTKKRWLKIAVNEHICMWHKTTGQQKKNRKKNKSHCSYRDKRQQEKKSWTGPLPKMLFILSAHERDNDRVCEGDGRHLQLVPRIFPNAGKSGERRRKAGKALSGSLASPVLTMENIKQKMK